LCVAILAALLLALTRRPLPKPSGVVPMEYGGSDSTELGELPMLPPQPAGLTAEDLAAQRERSAFEAAFAAADMNKDGKLDRAEFERFIEVAPKGVGIDVPQTPVKDAPPPPAPMAYPPAAAAYPPAAGAYPPAAGAYPPAAGAYPPAAGALTYPPEPLPQAPPPWEPTTTGTAALPTEDEAARAYLYAELDAQRQQIAQLQEAMQEVMQRGAAPPQPYALHGPASGYDHAAGAVLPPQPMLQNMSAYAPPMQVSGGGDPGSWPVPEGTQSGQVFLVNGEYYVAIPKPQSQPLPPIAAGALPQ